MSDQQAIHPDYFKDFREVVEKKQATNVEQLEKEEQMLADLTEMGGWHYLKSYIVELTDLLDSLVDSSMENGASYEEIGQKTIVAKTAKSFLIRVIERVENAKDAVSTGRAAT